MLMHLADPIARSQIFHRTTELFTDNA